MRHNNGGSGQDPTDNSTRLKRLDELMHPEWAQALEPVEPRIRQMGGFLREQVAQGHGFLPGAEDIFRAFQRPPSSVRVLVVGQDPYPTPGHAMGLSFSVRPQVRPVPRSLRNIYKELQDDLGITPVDHGDLSAWSDQGVLLLNRVLTVRPGAAGSHRGRGWEAVTEQAIRTLADRDLPLVSILWGKDAQATIPLLGRHPHLSSPHPSPLSAARGFFGSKPFSTANGMLQALGAEPIDWRLPPASA